MLARSVEGAVGEARALALLGIPVYVVGFPGANEDKLEAIAWAGNPANNGQSRPGRLCACGGSTCNMGNNDVRTNCWCV